MNDAPTLLRLGTAAKRLGWSRGKMRGLVDAGGVEVNGVWFRLRSVQAPTEREVREDDVAAVRAAIDAALK